MLVDCHKKHKVKAYQCPFFYSIGPKIGTSVAPPSMKSTEHGLREQMKPSSHLFPGKDVLIEVILNLLISDIYTKLLERIPLKILESKNIQNSNSITLISARKLTKYQIKQKQQFCLPVFLCSFCYLFNYPVHRKGSPVSDYPSFNLLLQNVHAQSFAHLFCSVKKRVVQKIIHVCLV